MASSFSERYDLGEQSGRFQPGRDLPSRGGDVHTPRAESLRFGGPVVVAAARDQETMG